ncbi:MAG: FMN-binding protein [Candidatus Omnitrophota bacterium]
MKEKIFMVIFVLVLGTLLTGLVVGVDYYTKPIIAKNEAWKLKRSMLDVFGIASGKQDLEEVFTANIRTLKKDGGIFYINRKKEVAFEFSGAGLWGPIYGVISFLPDLKTIKGIKIIYQEETPGLGGRISEDDYLRSFKGKTISPKSAGLASDNNAKENSVDVIAGATLSCKAFEKILNRRFERNIQLITEEEK